MTVQPDATNEPIEVRRNAGLLALVAFGSLAMALAYGWRASVDSSAVLWIVVGALCMIGILHLVAWIDARAPLLVADTHGVRLRVGREWRGLPWVSIDRVELEPRRGFLRDGRIVVVSETEDEPLSLPMGLATTTRAEEVVRRLTGLAKDRTAVSVRVSEAGDEPEPDAEPSIWESSAAEYAATRDEYEPPSVATDDEDETRFNPAGPVNDPGPAGPPTEPADPKPRRGAPVPAIQGAGRAVRADITRTAPSSIGMLALKSDPADLPEAHELRGTHGRVGLVIESTPVVEEEPEAEVVVVEEEPEVEPEFDPLIGPTLREARERLHLSVDMLAERTRIRPHVIESIEFDDFAPCGGDFYARGHLRSLSRVLGVDADELIRVYDDAYAQAPIEARKVFEAELATGPRPSIRLTTGGPNWAALIAVVLVLGIVWGAVQYFTGSEESDGSSGDTATANTSGAGAAASADKGELKSFGPPTRNRLVLTGRPGGMTQVVVRTSDGAVAWRGTLTAGQDKRLEVPGRAAVQIKRGAGVRTQVNGEAAGAMDARGPNSEATLGKK
ncbi:helix-turn-helix domain-containing protein [Solicola gregarius]|uniref:Helix-turn-helix domain-containing protein n=1 Tax=Solicola gregarius TaxID=2908642 RepID=A0AA46YKF8_9ACTN|nr:helix-turn-helix domain-containing protein [Solicola gregarius]UYM04529.1 helix-turn-helix domain-containing protein [Solicola gregarius]